MYEDRGYSSGPPSTSAVFVGGPMDGRCQILQGAPRLYQFAGMPSLNLFTPPPDADITPVPMVTYTYRVKADELGWPSITDDGLTRYEYVGDR